MRREQRFHVVHEDRWLIVVDKSTRLLTVPTDRGEDDTLVDLLDRYLTRSSGVRRRGAPRRDRERYSRDTRPVRARAVEVVHRLDRDTSGLIVFAKDPETADGLRAQFRDHSATRIYLALVAGQVEKDEGTFDTFMATNAGLHRYSTRKRGAGERAITHYRVRMRGLDMSAVDVKLETGRRNQIRVHFAEAGHPVLGDRRYGKPGQVHPHWPPTRLALHAHVLELDHPRTGERIRWESQMPQIFRSFMTRQEQRVRSRSKAQAAERRKNEGREAEAKETRDEPRPPRARPGQRGPKPEKAGQRRKPTSS
ncbi:MAG: RluA family pseudouridine synthase [Candidatus Eisenbacteria bacterium]